MTAQLINRGGLIGAPTALQRARNAVAGSSVLVRLVVLSVIAVTIERIWLGIGVPLWLDETWTAMIATRPDWASFWREAYLDVNAPFYYAFMKLWVEVAGTSNAMLRLPSFFFFYAAAALPLVWRSHGLDRDAALVWGALIILWIPGIVMTIDARTYALLMFAGTAGAIAFMQAFRSPSSRYLMLWAAIGAVQLLSHYFAYFLVAIQGLVLLARWRAELVRRWYTLLPFVLPFAWTLYHVGRVTEYGRPGIAWYDPTDFIAALRYTLFSFGAPSTSFAAVLILALGGALWKSNWRLAPRGLPLAPTAPAGAGPAIAWTVGTAVAALVVMLVFSSIKASLTDRYVVPMVPAMLLGVVLVAHRIPRRDVAYPLVVLVYAVVSLSPVELTRELQNRSNYGYERASDFVEKSRPEQLIFLWDHSNTQILDQTSLRRIGDFFLIRNGLAPDTVALQLKKGDDPNIAIREAVTSDKAAVIWLYDAQRNSAAKRFPPRLERDGGWDCRDRRSHLFRSETKKKELWVGTVGCVTTGEGAAR